jgi:hypothetical protein
MKFFISLFFFIIFSCGYPDINSVPKFKDLTITKQESIDLCNLSNTDTVDLSKCLNSIEKN